MVIVWSPFAAVLPWMPARIAVWPVDKPCGATVPIEIGEVQLAYPTARFWTVLKNHHRNSPNWSHGVKPDSSRRNYVLFPQGNYGTLWVSRAGLDLPPFLTQPVKTQNPSKGELSHGVVEKDVHEGVQAGCGAAAGTREFDRRGGAGAGGESQRPAPLAA